MQRLGVLVLVFCFLSGCASFGERSVAVRKNFAHGNLAQADAEIEKSLKKNKRSDADLLKLNRAIIALSSGKSKEAENLLREVRNNFDQLENTQVQLAAQKTLSMLTDDTAVAYTGEDYEKVLIRVFLALANLMHDGTDASAYALQIGHKQNDIIQKEHGAEQDYSRQNNSKAKRYRQVAIGQYLIGILQEATYRNQDDTAKAYEAVCRWEPNFSQARQDLERARRSVHAKQGNGVVYVFALAGEGPVKAQRNCEVLQDAQILTTAMLANTSNAATIPDFAPVMIPSVLRSREPIPSISVSITGISTAGRWNSFTETLTDISRMAEEQFEAIKPQIIARAVVRRALKRSAVYGTKNAVNADPWLGLAMDVGEMVWESLETADTRCWNLLPAEIQVTRLEVPAGTHQLTLQPMLKTHLSARKEHILPEGLIPIGNEQSQTITVEPGKNTYILANFPRGELAGNIVVNNTSLNDEPNHIAP